MLPYSKGSAYSAYDQRIVVPQSSHSADRRVKFPRFGTADAIVEPVIPAA